MIRHAPLLSRLLIILVLLTVSSTRLATAGPDALQARHDRADAAYVEALMVVAKWCRGSKLFGKRHDIGLMVLAFEPDHAEARKILKFKRGSDDAWTQPARYKRPRDWNPDLFPSFDERMAKAWTPYREAVLEICAAAETSRELSWAAATALRLLERDADDASVKARLKETLLAHLAVLGELEVPMALEEVTQQLRANFDGDPDVHRALGEVELDGRWLLPTTVRAVETRKRIAAEAKKALASVPDLEAVEPTTEEGAAGSAARGVYVTPHMRVLGTTTAKSLKAIARYCEAAGPFFDAVFGVVVRRAPTRTFFVFTTYDHWTKFIEAYGPISDEVRAHALTYKGSGYPLRTNVYVGLPVNSPAAELDLCVDVTFQTLLNEAFAAWYPEPQEWQVLPGWVRIGVSDYLTWRLTGKRILTTVGEDKYEDRTATEDRSPKANTKWLVASLATLQRVRAPGMHLMLGKELSAFEKDDALTSFGLAAYLAEARPDKVTRILSEVGKGRKTAVVIKEVLHLSVEALHVEVVRWLEETIAAR